MATTTIENPRHANTNRVLFWAVGILFVIAMIVFFTSRSTTTNNLDRTNAPGTMDAPSQTTPNN